RECVRAPRTQLERPPDELELRRLAADTVTCARRVEQSAAALPVDGAPVVGIDEAQVPQLVSLVDVGYAGTRQFEERLPERDALAFLGHAAHERLEALPEGDVVEQREREAVDVAFPILVRLEPARVRLRLAQRLLQIAGEPFGLDRPHAYECLVDEVLLVRVRRDAAAQGRVE